MDNLVNNPSIKHSILLKLKSNIRTEGNSSKRLFESLGKELKLISNIFKDTYSLIRDLGQCGNEHPRKIITLIEEEKEAD